MNNKLQGCSFCLSIGKLEYKDTRIYTWHCFVGVETIVTFTLVSHDHFTMLRIECPGTCSSVEYLTLQPGGHWFELLRGHTFLLNQKKCSVREMSHGVKKQQNKLVYPFSTIMPSIVKVFTSIDAKRQGLRMTPGFSLTSPAPHTHARTENLFSFILFPEFPFLTSKNLWNRTPYFH